MDEAIAVLHLYRQHSIPLEEEDGSAVVEVLSAANSSQTVEEFLQAFQDFVPDDRSEQYLVVLPFAFKQPR